MLCEDHYEPLVSRRNTPSVSLLVSSLHAFVHYLVLYSAKIHGLMNEQQNFAEANFEKLGPIPRICIDFVKDPSLLIDYENRYRAMVTSLTFDNIQHFVLQGGILDPDPKSHTMFIIRRNEVDDFRREHLEPISANAKMQLMVTINALERRKRVDLYHAFAFGRPEMTLAGLVYESLGHTHLQEGITLTIKPTTKLSPNRQQTLFCSKTKASNSIDQGDSPSETSVFFPPNPPIIYKDRLTSVKPGHLYVPKASNQASLDAFFKLGAIFYIFQFTVANKHDIKKTYRGLPSRQYNGCTPTKEKLAVCARLPSWLRGQCQGDFCGEAIPGGSDDVFGALGDRAAGEDGCLTLVRVQLYRDCLRNLHPPRLTLAGETPERPTDGVVPNRMR